MDDVAVGGRVTVFEAINKSLKEFYIGVSSLPISMAELAHRNQEAPPRSISHWRPEHQIVYICVESDFDLPESRSFLDPLGPAWSHSGWRWLTD